MITKPIAKSEVEFIVREGGNFTEVGLEVFAENFFEHGFQNISNRLYKDEMEELLNNLELNARRNGDEVCGAVMGKATSDRPSKEGEVISLLQLMESMFELGFLDVSDMRWRTPTKTFRKNGE